MTYRMAVAVPCVSAALEKTPECTPPVTRDENATSNRKSAASQPNVLRRKSQGHIPADPDP